LKKRTLLTKPLAGRKTVKKANNRERAEHDQSQQEQ
jgi:hypothetical protein